MRLIFLGTGTSTGVPQIGCRCRVCTSADPRDNRMRTSAIVENDNGRRLLIDCGPDFRSQALRAGSPEIEALAVTHSHYDHVGGIDDLRPYCYTPVDLRDGFPIYCRTDVADDLRAHMPYCFAEHPYPGVPKLGLHIVADGDRFEAAGMEVEVVESLHLRLPVLGFRIGPLAYLTDCKTIPQSTIDRLRGVDTLVINALRDEPHPSHMNLREALDVIHTIGPKRAFLTHLSHQAGLHRDLNRRLPDGVATAFDGLTVDL
ncbi:MAG: MBL fold metallo-hydrolase [Clostridium sp.]|nr:MBL fold metallo-hydrolase [Clostridium sp.]